MAIIKKKIPNLEIILIPSKDGLSLSDNTWNSGRSLALYEANLLIKYAKENKIADIEIWKIRIINTIQGDYYVSRKV